MSDEHLQWWGNLRHGGMLLDAQRLSNLITKLPEEPSEQLQDRLRREIIAFEDNPDEKRSHFVAFVCEQICKITTPVSSWYRGSNISASWTRRALTGEAVRPSHLWLAENDAILPVFIDANKRIGLGKGRRVCSQVLQWLRQGKEQLALITNGFQWRIVFAGLDYDAFCEWDIDLWFAEGQPSEELLGLVALLSPNIWTPPQKDRMCPLLEAVNDSRKGQSDLSQVLGERIRQAAEILIQAYGSVFNENLDSIAKQDTYRAAVHMIMRMVVVLFAESRDGLLPADNQIYHNSYSLQGLRELLERQGPNRLANSYSAWPRILALVRLIYHGCSHEALPVPSYGGELFAPGEKDSSDGMKRALFLLESACFEADVINDLQVSNIIELLTRTKIKIRQGRSATWMNAPVDFSCLASEYIGILYEGLLDFELRQAPEDEPIVFLAVGNQPALPLATLEAMDDRAIKNLLEKLKDTSSSDEPTEDTEAEEDVEPEEDQSDQAEDGDSDEVEDEKTEEKEVTDDVRYTMQARAENWARRACEVGGLIRRPRRGSPEAQMQYERQLASKARQLIVRTILPGEWYLVRWGGTRKGSGTFYTRPQLAIPTAHRTLQPLAYDPPVVDGKPNEDAPIAEWKPKKPEEILSLKVCDPACGSGSFCLAALRFLTEALYKSLRIHGRIKEYAGESILQLVYGDDGQELLAEEKLPCRPDDDNFELRTRAVLRRYIVERCIYGVDFDPLAVELARLSMWIETLDRNLPLTFLNHKIKCGNSLVGAWFDQFMHYPAMAWNREGGDKNHTNDIHFEKEKRTKAIKEKFKEVKADLINFIDGATLFYPVDLTTVKTGHDAAEKALEEIHALGITDVEQRAEKYQALLENPEFRKLKDAFDLWCAVWFWPAENVDLAPVPREFAEGNLPDIVWDIARKVAAERRFFHWELEFPDVFNVNSDGFDTILGNPPWDVSKPNSKEFFSAFDPLYRSYGKQEAVNKQKEYFQQAEKIEYQWLNYNAYFKAMSNWTKYAGFPFGDRITIDSKGRRKHDLNIGDRGRRSCETSQVRHDRWKQSREETSGYADEEHAFRHQGSADINLYKMFLEQAHSLLTDKGRLGLIVQSGLYSDKGTRGLRKLFLEECRWEWVFSFWNKKNIFPIDSTYRFCVVIIEKHGEPSDIRVRFFEENLESWNCQKPPSVFCRSEFISEVSPVYLIFPNINTAVEQKVFQSIYENSVIFASDLEDGWGIQYATEFHMTNDSKLFPPRTKWESEGYESDCHGLWLNEENEVAIPLYEGRMIGQFDFSKKGWISGKGRGAKWRWIDWSDKVIEPQFLISIADAGNSAKYLRLAFMDITRATVARTMKVAAVVQAACGNKAPTLTTSCWQKDLALLPILNSFVFDFVVKRRLSGLTVNYFVLEECPLPSLEKVIPIIDRLVLVSARLTMTHSRYAEYWLRLNSLITTKSLKSLWAVTQHERLRLRVGIDAMCFALFGADSTLSREVLGQIDFPMLELTVQSSSLDPKGFWRVDKDKHPEHRLTVLSYVAFCDLQEKIEQCGGDVEKGIEAFCDQNDGEGWMLPETLRLADYDLGHDDRAKEYQPVRECFGPRFYDWQLTQSLEESWKECHLHARDLLGEEGYKKLLAEIEGEEVEGSEKNNSEIRKAPPGMLFDNSPRMPLFDKDDDSAD